jgi:hypothetical protein
VRSSSHGHYQGCKWSDCRNRWFPDSGWTRVSRGSHAGHIPAAPVVRPVPTRGAPLPDTRLPVGHRPLLPGQDLRERTTTGEGLRLIPLETRDKRRYRRLDDSVKPPWEKRVYHDPESGES